METARKVFIAPITNIKIDPNNEATTGKMATYRKRKSFSKATETSFDFKRRSTLEEIFLATEPSG
jgi:hypothetical protein